MYICIYIYIIYIYYIILYHILYPYIIYIILYIFYLHIYISYIISYSYIYNTKKGSLQQIITLITYDTYTVRKKTQSSSHFFLCLKPLQEIHTNFLPLQAYSVCFLPPRTHISTYYPQRFQLDLPKYRQT